jgi:hypothetical protein
LPSVRERESWVRFYANCPNRENSFTVLKWVLVFGSVQVVLLSNPFFNGFNMLPVVHLPGGISFLIDRVTGHSIRRCQGVCSSRKHLLQVGSWLFTIDSCLARKQCPITHLSNVFDEKFCFDFFHWSELIEFTFCQTFGKLTCADSNFVKILKQFFNTRKCKIHFLI